MWQKIDTNLMNIEHNVFYKTSIVRDGLHHNVQELMFKQGLWWSKDGNYTYYAPTHYWVNS